MNYYKEIFLDFENNCKITPQIYNLFSAETKSDVNNKDDCVSRTSDKKGYFLSFDFYIIHCISESNSINLTITKTLNSIVSEKNTQLNFQSKYRFNFNENIINNEIFLYQTSEESFKISILFENQDIRQLEFKTKSFESENIKNLNTPNMNMNLKSTDNLPKFLVHEGSLPLDKLAKLTSVDHIFYDYSTKTDYFACGAASGNINILQVSNDFNNMLKMFNLREIRYDADYSQPNSSMSSSPFSFNFKQKLTQFFAAKPQPAAVKCVKYLKDNLLSYVTEDGKFRIFNQLTNKEVYCNQKIFGSGIGNNEEKILRCKIEFLDYDASRNFFLETSSKIVFFCVYIEYANSQFFNIFELQFLDIPLSNEIITNNATNNPFTLSDYGNNIRFNNNKLIKLSGKLIDLKTIKNKFWSVARKGTYVSTDLSEEALFNKYEIKIFNTFKIQNESEYENVNDSQKDNINSEAPMLNNQNNLNANVRNENFAIGEANKAFFNHMNQEVILLDHKLKNFSLTIKQLSLIKNEKSRNRSLYRLLLGAERIISNEQLINFNQKIAETNSSRLTANNPSTTHSRNFLRECEMQKELVNRAAILNRIFRSGAGTEGFNSDLLLNYIQNLICESFSNQIISLGYIRNKNLDSVCVLRDSGIGFLRFTAEFQKVNEAISFHEANIRELVFGGKSFEKFSNWGSTSFQSEIKGKSLSSGAFNKEIKFLQSRILGYISAQSQLSGENPLLVCFALLRILLSDNFINLGDYNFFVDFFNGNSESNLGGSASSNFDNNKNFKDFVQELFGEKLQKENSMLFLDVFNSLISKVFKSNVSLLLKSYEDLVLRFNEYQNSDLARKISKFAKEENLISGANRGSSGVPFVSSASANKYDFKFNYKFCEIIKKITQDKVEALLDLSRDLVAFSKWVEAYHLSLVSVIADKFESLEKTELLEQNELLNKMDISGPEEIQIRPLPRVKDENKSFKNIAQSALKIFSQCYCIFVLSNLSNSLMLPEKSAFEKLCIFIEEREDDNNFNYLDLKIYDMFNKYGQSIFKFFNEDLVDYLITNIWSGLFLIDDNNKAIRIKETYYENKKIIFKTFTNLLYFREIGLINSLLHLLYKSILNSSSEDQIASLINKNSEANSISEELECCFIRLVSYARLDNRKKFIKHLNNFIGVISNIDPEAEANVKYSFMEFYSNFTNSQSEFMLNLENNNLININDKKGSGGEAADEQSNLNFRLMAFYLLEEFLTKSNLLNGDLRFDFYYNSFNFIFPLIKNTITSGKHAVGQIANLNNINFTYPRNQRFLLDFLNSCLKVDFDLSLTFYLSIINEVYPVKNLNQKMLGLFVEYIIDFMKKPKNAQFFPRSLIPNINVTVDDKGSEAPNQPVILSLENNSEPNFSNNYLIEKIILSDQRLLISICKYLENECLDAKNNKKLTVYFGIKESLLKENLSNLKMDLKMSLNFFYLLHKIYSDMKDFHNAARISLLYNEALDDLIKGNVLSLDEMIRVYSEKNITLQNLAFSLKRIENKKSAFYLLKMKKLNSANTANNFINDKDYIELQDVKREKIMNDLRMRVLEELKNLADDNPTIKSAKENLQKVKNDTFLFNMIFKLNLDNYLNDFKILFNINENLTKNAIVNIIRVNLWRGETIKENEEISNFNKNKIFKGRERTNPNEVFTESEVKILKGETQTFIFNSALKKLFSLLVKHKNFIFISLAVETILSIHKNIDLPVDLLKEGILLNTKAMMELLIKYRREKDMLYLIEISESQDILIDSYLIKIGQTYLSSQNFDLNYIMKKYN